MSVLLAPSPMRMAGLLCGSDEAGVSPIDHLVEGPVPQPIDLGEVVAAGTQAAKDNPTSIGWSRHSPASR